MELNMKEFIEVVSEEVQRMIPGIIRDKISVDVREVYKTNDVCLHGMTIMLPDTNQAPTIYLEEHYEEYLKGKPIEEIAGNIIGTTIHAHVNAPEVSLEEFEYENIKDKLVMQLVDSDKNRERLKELVYKPVGNGFVMVPYIVMQEDEHGSMRAAVSKPMAEEFKYNIDTVFETAYLNTAELYEPTFESMPDLLERGAFSIHPNPEMANPLKEGFEIDPTCRLYVLSNAVRLNGATALYYPNMTKRLGEALGDNYYILPSSLHELMIVPEKDGPSLDYLKAMVKDANETVVGFDEVLSDKVLYYDREKDRLIEPKGKERSGEERGDR